MISVVMIVKNEEELLERCLETVKEADEIVIVDTGSTDKTVEIAKKYTGKIYFFKWIDSFSKARNFAASKATGDWIFTIDADQYLETPFSEVKKIVEETKVNILNVKEVSENGFWHYFPRLYKKNYAEWRADIHNYLSKEAEADTDIKIIYGYSPAHKKDPERALRILKKVVKENPGSVRERYYLAREYFYKQEWEKAIEEIDKYLKVAHWRPEINDAWLMRARCLSGLKKWEEAVDSAWQAIKHNANFGEALGFIAEHMGAINKERWLSFKALANNKYLLFVREKDTPMDMDPGHVEYFKSLLNKDVDVLEWGGGYSTRYFTDYMEGKVNYTWKTMEDNSYWASLIAGWGIKNFSLVLADKNSKDYLEPSGKFDIIFVDGRNRAQCVLNAKKLLKKDGVVILHDAQRERYQYAMKDYKGTFIENKRPDVYTSSLWVGRL